MEKVDLTKQPSRGDKEILYSKTIKAGTRIYYLDVKRNLRNECFLAITESKKNRSRDGTSVTFEKHKIFIYREDFEKFTESLKDVIEYIEKNSPPKESVNRERQASTSDDSSKDTE